MSNESKPWVLRSAAVALLSSMLVLSACGGGSSSPSPENPPPVEEDPVLPPEVGGDLTQVISGAILDKNTNSIIAAATVEFLENEAPATNITDLDGNVITELTTTDGTFEVAVKEGATITDFDVTAVADGYVLGKTVVDVPEGAELIEFDIELAAVPTVAAQVAVSAPKPVAAAEVQQETTFDTDEVVEGEDPTAGSATVTVDAGTTLTNDAGEAVTGTSINLNITFVEESDDAAAAPVAAVIPAGINEVADEVDVQIPLAAAQINITTDTGEDVTGFGTPITVTLNVPATTVLRSQNRPIAEADSLGVKSFDEKEGVWKTEGFAAVGALNVAKNTYPAVFTVDHLTFFAVTDRVPVCEDPLTLSYTGLSSIPAAGLSVRLFSDDLDVTGTIFPDGVTSETLTGPEMRALGVSANASAAIRVRDREGRVWWSTLDADGTANDAQGDEIALCGETIDIALVNPLPQPQNEVVDLTAVCSNDTTVQVGLTGALVKYRADSTKPYRIAPGNGQGGYSLTELTPDASYTVLIDANLPDVPLQTETISADGNGESFDVFVSCAGGTGTGGTGGSGG